MRRADDPSGTPDRRGMASGGTVLEVIRRLFRAVLIGVASVFPSGHRERHWTEPVVQEAPPGDHADTTT